jgi:hypothetical protein
MAVDPTNYFGDHLPVGEIFHPRRNSGFMMATMINAKMLNRYGIGDPGAGITPMPPTVRRTLSSIIKGQIACRN